MILDIFSTLTSNGKKFTPYDPSQEPIFPPELKLNHAKYSSSSIQFGKDLNLVSKVSNALYIKINFVRSQNYPRILFQSVKHDTSNNSNNEMSWFRPNSLNELLTLKNKFKGRAKIVVGNTELGVEMRAKRSLYPIMIQPNKVLNDQIVFLGNSRIYILRINYIKNSLFNLYLT